MEYLSKKERKKRTIRLFLGYGLIGIAVLLSTVILVYEAKGYDYDPETRQIIQNGLLFVTNEPVTADIYVNGKKEKSKTDAKLVLPAGQYDVSVRQDGYYDWNKKITLDGGAIEYATYIKLLPTTPEVTPIRTFATKPSLFAASPDRRWLFVQDTANNGQLQRVDLEQDKLSIDTMAYQKIMQNDLDPITSSTVVSWSKNSKYALIKQVLTSNASRYVLLNTAKPDDSKIVLDENPVVFDFIDFRGDRDDSLYIRDISDNSIKTVDISLNTAGPGMINLGGTLKVLPDESIVNFSINSTKPELTNVYIFDPASKSNYLLGEVATDKAGTYDAQATRFNSSWLTTISSASDDRIQIFVNPLGALKAQEEKKQNKQTISEPYKAILKLRVGYSSKTQFSDTGRFIAVQSGSTMVVYDADLIRTYRYELEVQPVNAPAGTLIKSFSSWNWFDNSHIALYSGQTQVVCEFDKTNCVTTATSLLENTTPVSKTIDAMYTLTSIPSGISLQKVSLIAPKKN